jgi:hypothetical protein
VPGVVPSDLTGLFLDLEVLDRLLELFLSHDLDPSKEVEVIPTLQKHYTTFSSGNPRVKTLVWVT